MSFIGLNSMKPASTFGLLPGMILASVAGAAVTHRPGPIDAASVPFALRYAACVYSIDPQHLQACPAVRAIITAQADTFLSRAYPRTALQSKRRFTAFLSAMETEAESFRKLGKPLTTPVIAYVACLAEAANAELAEHTSPSTYDGDAVADACETQRKEILRVGSTTEKVVINGLRFGVLGKLDVQRDVVDQYSRSENQAFPEGFFQSWVR